MRRVRRRTTLVQEIVEIILDVIRTGELAPGQKLPPEMELARELRVARTTVRESIMLLMGMGVLRKDHDGIFLVDDLSHCYQSGLIPKVLVEGKVEELYEARRVVEGEIAALAAVRASKEDINCLKSINAALNEAITNNSRYKELDLKFHQAVATAAHNSVLSAMYDVTRQLLDLLDIDRVDIETIKSTTVERHRSLISAIEARDPVAARECARKLVEEVGQDLLAKIKEKKSSSGLEDSGEVEIQEVKNGIEGR